MNRAGKEELVEQLNQTFTEIPMVVITHNLGLSVGQMNDLRSQMRSVGARLKVIKNRLAKRAIAETPYQDLEGLFSGPTTVAFSDDPVAAAKVAVDFAKKNNRLVVLGGGVGAEVLDADGVKALATLPSLDELRATIVGLLSTPATWVAGVLQAPAGQLARVLAARAEQGAGEAESEAA